MRFNRLYILTIPIQSKLNPFRIVTFEQVRTQLYCLQLGGTAKCHYAIK